MKQLSNALKRKVRQWQSSMLRWSEFGIGAVLILIIFAGSIVSLGLFVFVRLAAGLGFPRIFPLVMLAVQIASASITTAVLLTLPLIALMWKFRLEEFHPLIRRLGSHKEQRRNEAFQQLLQMGNEAIPLFIQALNTPDEPAPYGDWCGFWAHRLAIEGLGQLKAKSASKVLLDALKHRDPEVKAKAAWALGEIGVEEAVPELIPLLVYEADPDDRENVELELFVHQSARESLKKLGKGELVEALLQVLERERDEEAVERLRSWLLQYRSAIVRALLNALQGRNMFAAVQAAWALGKLNAVEALPILERLAYSPFVSKELRQVCRESVSWLSTIATLPSPADLTRASTENLPAIPDPNTIPTDTLPKSAPIHRESD